MNNEINLLTLLSHLERSLSTLPMTAYRSAERKRFIAGVTGPISSSSGRSDMQTKERMDILSPKLVEKMRNKCSPTNGQMAFLDDRTGLFRHIIAGLKGRSGEGRRPAGWLFIYFIISLPQKLMTTPDKSSFLFFCRNQE